MDILDTRDLIETRESLQNQIIEAFNEVFNTDYQSFEDIDLEDTEQKYNETKLEEFNEVWTEELEHLKEIEEIETTFSGEFEYGVTLVNDNDFVEYVEELLVDIGYIPKNMPSWIEIDYEKTANNVEQDYTTVSYRGNDYLGRG